MVRFLITENAQDIDRKRLRMHDELENSNPPKTDRRLPWGWLLLLGFMATIYLSKPGSAPNFDGWETTYDQALTKAAASNENVLIAFYMNGCGYCDAMDRTVLNQPAVRSSLEQFVPVRINMEQAREVANRYGVMGAPTFAVVTPNGAMLDMAVGYQPEEEFIGFLEHNAGRTRNHAAASAKQATNGP